MVDVQVASEDWLVMSGSVAKKPQTFHSLSQTGAAPTVIREGPLKPSAASLREEVGREPSGTNDCGEHRQSCWIKWIHQSLLPPRRAMWPPRCLSDSLSVVSPGRDAVMRRRAGAITLTG